jgi:hypothetical protein
MEVEVMHPLTKIEVYKLEFLLRTIFFGNRLDNVDRSWQHNFLIAQFFYCGILAFRLERRKDCPTSQHSRS